MPASVLLALSVLASSNARPPTETIVYEVQTAAGIYSSSAFVRFPVAMPEGVVLLWHGTILGSHPQFGTLEQEFQSLVDSSNGAFDRVIVIYPHQIGLGETLRTRHQRWQILDDVRSDGAAVLLFVHRALVKRYSLPNSHIHLPLMIYGHSQGGSSAAAFHLFFPSITELQQKYDLAVTVASAGHYSADVWVASTMLQYQNFTSDTLNLRSFDARLMPFAAKMQHVLLAHLLYTYATTRERKTRRFRASLGRGLLLYDAAAGSDGQPPVSPRRSSISRTLR
jgi:hypothetical protein